jgi:hypothetical protein
MLISNLNLEGIESKLVKDLGDDYTDDEMNEVKLPDMFSENLINDFNKRNITHENINEIITLLDFLNVEQTVCRKFVLDNLQKSEKIYFINVYHLRNYNFPKFLLEGFDISNNNHLREIIKHDNLSWLKYAYTRYGKESLRLHGQDYKLIDYTCLCCSLNCLKFLISIGFKINEYTLEHAIRSKKLECVRFLIEDEQCSSLVEYKYINLFNMLLFSSEFGTSEILDYIINKFEIRNENEDALYYSNCIFTDSTVREDNVDTLKYLYNNNFEIRKEILMLIFEWDSIDCLKYLVDNVFDLESDEIITKFGVDLWEFQYKNVQSTFFGKKYDCLVYLVEKFKINISENILCILVDLNKFELIKSILYKQANNGSVIHYAKAEYRCITQNNLKILDILIKYRNKNF